MIARGIHIARDPPFCFVLLCVHRQQKEARRKARRKERKKSAQRERGTRS